MKRRAPRNFLDAQAMSRRNLADAAQVVATLAAAPSQLLEYDAGTITNRVGIRQKVTVFVRIEELGEEGE